MMIAECHGGDCHVEFKDRSFSGRRIKVAVFKENSYGQRDVEKWYDLRPTDSSGRYTADFRIPGESGYYHIHFYEDNGGSLSYICETDKEWYK